MIIFVIYYAHTHVHIYMHACVLTDIHTQTVQLGLPLVRANHLGLRSQSWKIKKKLNNCIYFPQPVLLLCKWHLVKLCCSCWHVDWCNLFRSCAGSHIVLSSWVHPCHIQQDLILEQSSCYSGSYNLCAPSFVMIPNSSSSVIDVLWGVGPSICILWCLIYLFIHSFIYLFCHLFFNWALFPSFK